MGVFTIFLEPDRYIVLPEYYFETVKIGLKEHNFEGFHRIFNATKEVGKQMITFPQGIQKRKEQLHYPLLSVH